MAFRDKTLKRLPPTSREIAKALNDIERGVRTINRLFGPKAVRQGLTNVVQMEIAAQVVTDSMPTPKRKAKYKVDANACAEHAAGFRPNCPECLDVWKTNSGTALKARAANDSLFD